MKFATHFCLSRFLRVWLGLILTFSLLAIPAFAADTSGEDVADDTEIIQEATPQLIPAPARPDPSTMLQSIPDSGDTSDEEVSIVHEEVNDDERPKNRLNIAAWITDSNGDITKQLYANTTYTIHTRAEVIGEVVAERARIWVYDAAGPRAVPNCNDQWYASILVGAVGDNVGYDSSEAQFRSATEDCLWVNYVSNSARLAMAGEGGVIDIDDAELLNYELGVLLGYDAADGNLPVGREYACEITFQIETSPFISKNPTTDTSVNETDDKLSVDDAGDTSLTVQPVVVLASGVVGGVTGGIVGLAIYIACLLLWKKHKEKRDRNLN